LKQAAILVSHSRLVKVTLKQAADHFSFSSPAIFDL